MRRILIAKDVNYGASVAAAAVNTAITPDLLREGAIGIYGIDRLSANNANTLALIKDGGSDAVGTIPAASYAGNQLMMYVGTPTGPVRVLPMQKGNLSITSAKYQAPIKGVTFIGWNGTEGTLNLGTVLERDEAEIVSIEDLDQNRTKNKVSFSSALKANNDAFTVLRKIMTAYGKVVAMDSYKDIHLLEVVSNGTFTALAQNVDVVNGSPAITFAANVTVATGANLRIGGINYKVITGVTAGTAVTLDSPYTGVTATVVAANVGTLASITEYGLKITNKENYKVFDFAVRGVLEDATITYAVVVEQGTGSSEQVLAIEKDARALRGVFDQIISYMPMMKLTTDSSVNYDIYNIVASNSLELKDQTDETFVSKVEVAVVFPTGIADTGGKNQSDFEDIIAVFYPSLVSLF